MASTNPVVEVVELGGKVLLYSTSDRTLDENRALRAAVDAERLRIRRRGGDAAGLWRLVKPGETPIDPTHIGPVMTKILGDITEAQAHQRNDPRRPSHAASNS